MPTQDAAVYFTDVVDMSNASNVHYKAGSITDSALAASGIQIYTTGFGIDVGAVASAVEWPVLVARAAGTLKFVYAGLVNTGTATVSVDFDLNINGSTALDADINVDHSDADRANVAGTLSTTAVTAGQVITCSCEPGTPNDCDGPFMLFGILWTATAS